MATALVACEDDILGTDDDPTNGGTQPVSVEADFDVNPDEPTIGTEVELDGGASTITGTNDVSWQWTLEAPDDSDAELSADDEQGVTFEPDLPGEYTVTLVVIAGEESDETSKVIEVAAIEEITTDIAEDRTLYAHTRYIVTGQTSLLATLTIEPGTIVEFEQEAYLRVRENGVLVANGNQDEPILLTGTNEEPGWWAGVWLQGTGSPDNLMNHVTVEYAGFNAGYYSGYSDTAALLVGGRTSGDNARLQLTNSTLRHNSGYGLKVTNESHMPDASGNLYTLNNAGAVKTEAHLIHYLSDDSDFTGNLDENDHVLVEGSTVNDHDVIWKAINAPFIVADRVRVIDIDLTIEAGANFLFDSDADLIFEGDGRFHIAGTENNPVTFSGTQQEAGWWGGIQLFQALNPNNLIENAVVEYGGGHSMYDFSTQSAYANLLIGGRTSNHVSRVEVNSSTFRHSGGFGLKISGDGSEMPDSQENTYTENSSGAVYMSANTMHFLDSASDYSGNLNGNDFVRVTSTTVTGSEKEWNALNVPYRMSGETRPTEVTIIIEEGAGFEFTSGAGISFREGSVISAIGSGENRIHFTGTEEVKGWWSGIQISSNSPQNEIAFARFDYGGGDDGFGNFSTQSDFANLLVGGRTSGDAGRLTATDNIFANSGDYGLKVTEDSDVNSDICSENLFEDNDGGTCLDLTP